jgi:hypothetical protein
MGTMTLADFRDELRFICGGIQASSPAWPNSRLDRRINASYLWCSMPNHYQHPELENRELLTIAATGTYTPGSVYYQIVSVTHAEAFFPAYGDNTRRTKLYPVDPRELMSLQRPVSKPSRYAYWNRQILIDCIPATPYIAQQLELYGYRQPPVLASATETALLKAEWDEIILVGAEWRMWLSLNEADRAYEAKQNLGTLVNEVADVRKLHAQDWDWQTGSTSYPGHMRTD